MTREEPPGAGPVPALRAGLAEAAAPWVAVLAADLPFLDGDQVLSLLAAARDGTSAGAVIADESGAEQWLAGCWRTGRLGAALAGYQGSSLRGLLAPLRPVLIRRRRPRRAARPPGSTATRPMSWPPPAPGWPPARPSLRRRPRFRRSDRGPTD